MIIQEIIELNIIKIRHYWQQQKGIKPMAPNQQIPQHYEVKITERHWYTIFQQNEDTFVALHTD